MHFIILSIFVQERAMNHGCYLKKYGFISWFSFVGPENGYQDIRIQKCKIWALRLSVQHSLSSCLYHGLFATKTVWESKVSRHRRCQWGGVWGDVSHPTGKSGERLCPFQKKLNSLSWNGIFLGILAEYCEVHICAKEGSKIRLCLQGWFLGFNATFNTIQVITPLR